ncbi:MAG: lamin tail domain-containing protein [Agriterribacter sp.]
MKNTLLAFALLACHLYSPGQTKRYDVVINEIMSNPAPAVGLPGVKYIELLNVSSAPINLKGWTLSDESSVAIIKIQLILQPDSFVIISSTSNANTLAAYGKTIGVSNFPTLRVNGDMLTLRSADNIVIHAVQYERNWHENAVKNNGGWSLEMVDSKNPCNGSTNWESSIDSRGGTPGTQNSVARENKDEDAPQLLHAYAESDSHIVMRFNEPLDSSAASQLSNYDFTGNTGIIKKAAPLPPFFNQVRITVSTALEKNKVYEITAKNATDCAGNRTNGSTTVKTGLADDAGEQDIIFNEILFNPADNGTDYIELYNRSKRIVNAKELWISNRNASGNIGTLKQLTGEDRLIFPGDFVVLTESKFIVLQQFVSKNPDAFIEMVSVPSMPDESGDVVLMNKSGEILDELPYAEDWHFPLIANYEGVALERIDPEQPGSEKKNWFSAASSVGYGTPGYQNSQFRSDLQLQGTVTLTPSIFSPDSDGFDDYLLVNYTFPEAGYICNITAFDASGRLVKQVVRNGICSVNGYYRWDGLDEKNQRLPIGIYIILTEVYNVRGKTKKFKHAVTLARRIN